MLITPTDLTRILNLTPRRHAPNTNLKHSAVMMILFERPWNNDPATHVVFIMKTSDGSRHAGQIAFPGGKVDPGDGSALAAALRETHEEIGVAPAELEVLGSLGYFSTMTTGFDAAVFLARPHAPLHYFPQKSEVAAIFEIPCAQLLHQYDPTLQLRTPSDMLKLHFHIAAAPYARFTASRDFAAHDQICIWGFTARVLQHFLKLLLA